MKKLFICLLCLLLVFCISGCSINNKNLELESNSVKIQSNDIDVTAPVPAKATESLKMDMGNASMMSPIKTDEEKFDIDGSVVLHGKVVKSNYVLDGSTVYTKSEVEVIKCYKGDLAKGDIVSVRELGGFVPSDVYNNAVYNEKYGCDAPETEKVELLDMRVNDFKVMETSEDVILFLVPITSAGLDEFKTDCYDLIRMWQGKLLYNDKYNVYVPYVPEEELAVKSNGTAISTGVVQAKTYSLNAFEKLAISKAEKQAVATETK